jgi:hypothetical protein
MPLRWLDTETKEEVARFQVEFWQDHKDAAASGEFWADRIVLLREEPGKRLVLALDNLPLPAAFREAAVAVRTLIRAKRKLSVGFVDELTLLYWLAAVSSFSVPYSEVLNEPGNNVFAAIPGKRINGLHFTYSELGYEHLSLLGKTDVKWIEEAWGTPDSHTTLHTMHIDLWREYEEKLRLIRSACMEKWVDELEALLAS